MTAPGDRPNPFRPHKEGLSVEVRLTPKASANRIDGVELGAGNAPMLKARVAAVPEKGKANDALLKLLAKSWALPRTSLRIASGAKHRNKTVIITGPRDGLEADMKHWLDSLAQGEGS